MYPLCMVSCLISKPVINVTRLLLGHGLPNCKKRCEKSANDTFPMCSAATKPYFDLDHHYSHSIFSPDPAENPAFFDYDIGKNYNMQLISMNLNSLQHISHTAAVTATQAPGTQA